MPSCPNVPDGGGRGTAASGATASYVRLRTSVGACVLHDILRMVSLLWLW